MSDQWRELSTKKLLRCHALIRCINSENELGKKKENYKLWQQWLDLSLLLFGEKKNIEIDVFSVAMKQNANERIDCTSHCEMVRGCIAQLFYQKKTIDDKSKGLKVNGVCIKFVLICKFLSNLIRPVCS